MHGQFKCLGRMENLSFGPGCSITREPWPFFDVKGGGLHFGEKVVISAGVNILTHSHSFDKKDWRERGEIKPEDPTIVSDNVFLGVNAIIMPGCKYIGENSVIGAGAVVTRNVPDNEIWAGNPATKIGDVT